jgi:hypothetical protein
MGAGNRRAGCYEGFAFSHRQRRYDSKLDMVARRISPGGLRGTQADDTPIQNSDELYAASHALACSTVLT